MILQKPYFLFGLINSKKFDLNGEKSWIDEPVKEGSSREVAIRLLNPLVSPVLRIRFEAADADLLSPRH